MSGSSGNSFRALREDEWIDFVVNHSGLKHYTSLRERPGNMVTMTAVEYYLFPPGTPSNDAFHFNIVEWGRYQWHVFSVPEERHQDVVSTADALAMTVRDDPPAMLYFGVSAMLMTASLKISESALKQVLVQSGCPEDLVKLFSGLEPFPGAGLGNTHSIENNSRRLTSPLLPDEIPAICERDRTASIVLSNGARPPLSDIADYVYGNGRVLPQQRQAPRPG